MIFIEHEIDCILDLFDVRLHNIGLRMFYKELNEIKL